MLRVPTRWLPPATLATLALLAAAPARAQADPGQAATMEQDLRAWLAHLLAPLLDAATIPLHVTPDGERYRLEIGLAAIPGVTMTASQPTTVLLRPLAPGRWAIDEASLPARQSAGIDAIDSGFDSAIAEQHMAGEFDTTFASPSHFDGTLRGLAYTTRLPGLRESSRMDSVTFAWHLEPGDAGTQSGSFTATVEHYAQEHTPATGSKQTTTVDRITATSRVDGFDPARMTAAIAAGVSLVGTPIPQGDAIPEPQRAAVHALLDAITGLYASAATEQAWSGAHLRAGDMNADLAEFGFAADLAAPNGDAQLRMRLSAAGLAMPMLAQTGFAELVPRRVVLAQRVSGIPKEVLVAFLSHAIDTAGNPDADLASEAMQMLADNPLTIAIDELAIDLGASKLTGSGQLQVASPADVTGAAELRVTGMDALIRLLSKNKNAAPAMPFVLMIKGLGKPEGAATVWRIAYTENKLTVNGTDLAAMMAHPR